jgi:hypothetical protein
VINRGRADWSIIAPGRRAARLSIGLQVEK